eukprot:scaffold24447_cov17-Tisochrysis_lutea.AAC.1
MERHARDGGGVGAAAEGPVGAAGMLPAATCGMDRGDDSGNANPLSVGVGEEGEEEEEGQGEDAIVAALFSHKLEGLGGDAYAGGSSGRGVGSRGASTSPQRSWQRSLSCAALPASSSGAPVAATAAAAAAAAVEAWAAGTQGMATYGEAGTPAAATAAARAAGTQGAAQPGFSALPGTASLLLPKLQAHAAASCTAYHRPRACTGQCQLRFAQLLGSCGSPSPQAAAAIRAARVPWATAVHDAHAVHMKHLSATAAHAARAGQVPISAEPAAPTRTLRDASPPMRAALAARARLQQQNAGLPFRRGHTTDALPRFTPGTPASFLSGVCAEETTELLSSFSDDLPATFFF